MFNGDRADLIKIPIALERFRKQSSRTHSFIIKRNNINAFFFLKSYLQFEYREIKCI